MGLQFYIQDTTALLHDQRMVFTPEAQLVRWINEARVLLAKETGCVRRLITGQSAFGASAQPGAIIAGAMQPGALPSALPSTSNPVFPLGTAQNTLQTIAGVERYPYQGFWNPFAQQQYAGIKGVLDVNNLSVSWGGNFRPSLTWMPWDDLQAYCRSYSNQTTAYPSVWSVYNDGEFGEIWLFPVPSQPNEIEADAYCVPADIYSDDDFDAIPSEMRDCIKYKAAALAFLAAQKFGQADMMEQRFAQTAGIDVVARDRGKTRNYYYRTP